VLASDVVNAHVLVTTEVRLVDEELAGEIDGFEAAWAKHEHQLTQTMLKARAADVLPPPPPSLPLVQTRTLIPSCAHPAACPCVSRSVGAVPVFFP
jgi:hypothetical protein